MREVGASKKVRDVAFGKRLTDACDQNSNVPPRNFGRLGWVRERLSKDHDLKVSVETVRKWMAGEVRPKHSSISKLARLLEVSEGWLALGIREVAEIPNKRRLNFELEGAIITVAGLIKMAGGKPESAIFDGERVVEAGVDLYALIRNVRYPMHISLGRQEGESINFQFGPLHDGVLQIGVVAVSDFAVRLIEIPSDILSSKGIRQGNTVEIKLGEEEIAEYEISTLRERL